ncbi:hypothetical protein ACWGNZ_04020 [Sphingomonas zeae]|jgi:hypothetical protein
MPDPVCNELNSACAAVFVAFCVALPAGVELEEVDVLLLVVAVLGDVLEETVVIDDTPARACPA